MLALAILVQVLCDPNMPHAGYMLDLDWQQQIVDHMQQLNEPAKGAAAAATTTTANKVQAKQLQHKQSGLCNGGRLVTRQVA